MEAGIVGLPNVGKSTLFNALTSAGIASENYPFCTIEPNVGAVPVPDSRLDVIQGYIKTQKVIPAILQLVDIAGIVRGASEGEGLGNKFLTHIRNVDAILHAVRCFEDGDITHVDGSVDPLRDIETIDTELMLADLQSVESMLDKAKRTARTGDKDAKRRVGLLEQCHALLADGKAVRGIQLEDPADQKEMASFQLLTAKRVLYVANVEEDDLKGEGELVQRVRKHAEAEGSEVVPVCARLEAELSELDADDRAELLESVGLEEPALALLARAAYRVLGLQSYFTAGEKEVRAWTVPIGATAPQAAGVIHTDFERGFIRAEVYSVDDLTELKSEKAIRDAGKMRVEGKSYTMHDGDVCHFLFNV
ncbi:Ribosome-binding ATPase YchF [Pseudobythopirellula maris]|uniref:Ribosome-binding ATPase YchF n=1 Tax=Pseudobythopirellula maris TaxID=2527991 RepID=A0A5C5ZMG0_9BACT|nr:redox-regulated ATPase YchF [Pseudobythopirellula maris]TWT88664.1 Ribosome-binding ATPase YchF [Pseudobythopirellula maris]